MRDAPWIRWVPPAVVISIQTRRLREGKTLEDFLERTAPEEARRHERIAEVIEPASTRAFYVQVADDNLS
jgi:hypothetical protein